MPNVDSLRKAIMEETHCSAYAMHPSNTKMYWTIKENYWWSGMKNDIAKFVSRCLVCQQVNAKYQKLVVTLQPLPILEWKWEHITMNFVVGLPHTQAGHDAIRVIVNRLTKSVHFPAIHSTFSLDRLARLYIDKIVKSYGVPVTIVLDRETNGHYFTFQYYISSANWWSVWKDYLDFGRYTSSLCIRI